MPHVTVNQELFGVLRKRLHTAVEQSVPTRGASSFLCECGAVDCQESINVPLHVYEGVRLDQHRRLVAPAHAQPDREEILQESRGYVIVRR